MIYPDALPGTAFRMFGQDDLIVHDVVIVFDDLSALDIDEIPFPLDTDLDKTTIYGLSVVSGQRLPIGPPFEQTEIEINGAIIPLATSNDYSLMRMTLRSDNEELVLEDYPLGCLTSITRDLNILRSNFKFSTGKSFFSLYPGIAALTPLAIKLQFYIK